MLMKEKEPFDFARFKDEAMEGLYSGKKAVGTDGVFAPLLKHLLESMVDRELNNHLSEEKAGGQSNRRNGKSRKTVRSLSGGSLELETGRDREGSFEPKIVPKR